MDKKTIAENKQARRSTFQEVDEVDLDTSEATPEPMKEAAQRLIALTVSKGLRYDWSDEQAGDFDADQIEVARWTKVTDISDEVSGNMSLSQLRELMIVCGETADEHMRRAESARLLALRISRAAREAFEVYA